MHLSLPTREFVVFSFVVLYWTQNYLFCDWLYLITLTPLLRLFLSIPKRQLWLETGFSFCAQKSDCKRMGIDYFLGESILVTCFHQRHSLLPPLKELYLVTHRSLNHFALCFILKDNKYWIFKIGVLGRCLKL